MKMNGFRLSMLFLVMLFPSVFWAQSEADSLKLVLTKAEDDTGKVIILNRLCFILRTSAPEEALKYGESARNLSEKLRYEKGIGDSYSHAGVIYYRSGDFTTALKMHFQALRIREKMDDRRGKGITYINLGNIYSDQQNNQLALDYYKNALSIFEELGDRSKKAILYLNISSIYIAEKKYEAGLKYVQLAREEAHQSGDKETEALALNNAGVAQLALGKLEESYQSHMQAYALSESAGDHNGMVDASINIGRALRMQNQVEKAIEWHRKSEKMAIQNNYPEGLRVVYEGLSNDYEYTGDLKQSLFYARRFKELSDSLYNLENTERINDLTFRWQKERQDHLLTSMREEINKRKNDEVKSGIWLWLISGGLLIVLIFSGYMVFAAQTNRRLKTVIATQQEQISRLSKNDPEKNQF